MKRLLIAILLSITILFSFSNAFALGDTDEVLNGSELNDWLDLVKKRAETSELLNSEPILGELGYGFQYDFATLYYDKATLDNAVLQAVEVFSASTPDPRSILLSSSIDDVLQKYPNDNPSLVGDYDFAALFIEDTMPDDAYYGCVMRDGQHVLTIQYAIIEPMPGSKYSNITLEYKFDEDRLYTFGVYGLNEFISMEDAILSVESMSSKMKLNSYHGYPTSSDGSTLTPFDRDDLIFSNFDYLEITPDKAKEIFGTPIDETWIQDSSNAQYYSLSWNSISMTFLCDINKVPLYLQKLSIKDDTIEGPRAVRMGDTITSVYQRFKFDKFFDINSDIDLYGDGITAPYATATSNATESSLKYTCSVSVGENDERTIILNLTFTNYYLSEILLITR